MDSSIPNWHHRFLQQAAWTRQLRSYVYTNYGVGPNQRILDAGCGTGALLPELEFNQSNLVYGVDLEIDHLRFANKIDPSARLLQADIHKLPFLEHYFDFCLLHYVVLWLKHPVDAITELKRVTRPGGYILALAEPDYGARIDYPDELEILGRCQRESLSIQGADPKIGRKLKHIFQNAGLDNIECGIIGGEWKTGSFNEKDWETEWSVIKQDMEFINPSDLNTYSISQIRAIDYGAHKSGTRILFVPTFYAVGMVP